jgi:hypothetical protein
MLLVATLSNNNNIPTVSAFLPVITTTPWLLSTHYNYYHHHHHCKDVQQQQQQRRLAFTDNKLFSSSSQQDDNNNKDRIIQTLLEKADQLRKEVKELEDGLLLANQKRNISSIASSSSTSVIPQYKTLADSTWTITYRFSSNPRNDDADETDEISLPSSSTEDGGGSFINNSYNYYNNYYSGKYTVSFRADGYTDLISHVPTTTTSVSGEEGASTTTIVIEKVWGWDKEVSNEDGLAYLLFSTSIRLPSKDRISPNQEIRYYWQARIVDDDDTATATERNERGIITLHDGTVTMKQNVGRAGGFWGAFSGTGILAQFRYVGNFHAKAASRMSSSSNATTTTTTR